MAYVLALRGELSSKIRKQQAKKINSNATTARPGLCVSDPQPFISKLEVRNGGQIVTSPFSFQRHASSSRNSPYVSFTGITTILRSDNGFKFQATWNIRKAKQSERWQKSFLTTKSNLTSINPFASGNEKEILLRGHLHRTDNTMVNHIITKTKNIVKPFKLKSRRWNSTNFRWETWSQDTLFRTVRGALFFIIRRGHNV